MPNQLNINQHKDLLKEYKRLCRYKQIEFWNKETERIKKEEENIWEIWKTLGESNAQIEHLNADGKIWEEYFTDLYNQKFPNGQHLQVKPETPNQSLNKVFTLSELTNAIKSLKNKKAVGYCREVQ